MVSRRHLQICKEFMKTLFLSLALMINSNISRLVKNTDFMRIIYNSNLYLFNTSNSVTEPYVEEIRFKIIRNIKPLVIINTNFKISDTLQSLAYKIGTDINSVRSTNYIEAIGLLYPGKTLLLHNKKGMLYKIKNETEICHLAKKFNISLEELCDINNLSPVCKLYNNDFIFIPNRYIRFKDFMLPLYNTKITSKFGLRKHPVFGILKYHEGIDLKQKYGAVVRAASDGKVIFAGWAEGYGNLVIIKHAKGYTTYYGHLSKIRVKIGKWVYKGQTIGNVGNTGWTTGPHLHFEVRKDGVPVDPKKVLF
ncbi:MAG: M23 family metallopeptidase [Endomicrobia bacterium]|nr:M23 family metallopeptidase [Endomicrobiia bacterium]